MQSTTLRSIRGNNVILSMTLLAGAVSFFIGNAYQAQMPNFATDLGHGDAGVSYAALAAADAAGALIGAIMLESARAAEPRESARAIILSMLWCVALAMLRADALLCAAAGHTLLCRLSRAVIQRDGTNAGAAECAARTARSCHRCLCDGRLGIALRQRLYRRNPRRQSSACTRRWRLSAATLLVVIALLFAWQRARRAAQRLSTALETGAQEHFRSR